MNWTLSIDTILASAPLPIGTPPAQAIGRSRADRPLHGYTFGHGPLAVSLIAGCHADEPVGPAMLDRLVAFLAGLPTTHPLLEAASWRLVPHVNPDGEARNAGWSHPFPTDDRGYELAAYLRQVEREPPGDDVEFGFPHHADDHAARPENRAVATFLAAGGPIHLHATFHGMAFAAGPWFLLEEGWIGRTRAMRDKLRQEVRRLGYRPHDVDRHGEKGFTRIDEGFTTRPDSRAMRRFFEARDEPEMAALFRPSSMEYVRTLGGDPLTLVSEMPLFLYPAEASHHGEPPLPTEPESAHRFVAWAHRLAQQQGAEALATATRELGLRPMPIGDQMRLQLAFLEAGIQAVVNR